MKKTFLTLFFVCLAGAVLAQGIEFQMGKKTNSKAYSPKMIHLSEGVQEGQLLVVEPNLKAVAVGGYSSNSIKALKVRLCDSEWKDTKNVTLLNSKGAVVENTFRTDNLFHVIFSNTEKDVLHLRHVALDAQTLATRVDEDIYSTSVGNGKNGYVLTASSPDGRYFGAVCVLWNRKNVSTAKALMFDKEMNKLWEQELAYGDISYVIVNNDGSLATLQQGSIEGDKKNTAFRVNLANADGEKHGEFAIEAYLTNSTILNCKDGNIVALSIEKKGYASSMYTSLWSLIFDLDKNELRVGNQHNFTNEETRVFANGSEGENYSKHEADNLDVVDFCQTSQGGAALVQRRWRVVTRDARTGMTTGETVHCKGMLLVQSDMEGNLTIKNIPQNNQFANWPSVGADVFTHGDNIYVVTNESKEETNEYTPNRPAKRSKSLIMANAALAVYWFTPNGQGAKQMLEKENKAILCTPLSAGNGDRFYFLTTNSIYPHICTVTLPSNK